MLSIEEWVQCCTVSTDSAAFTQAIGITYNTRELNENGEPRRTRVLGSISRPRNSRGRDNGDAHVGTSASEALGGGATIANAYKLCCFPSSSSAGVGM